ncbi:MAG: DUF1178 family protein [Burkholderiaceae bacterium]
MKVFNLSCEHDHQFEGWFGSSQDYDQQLEKNLLTCPMCNSSQIRRLPSAPRLNLSGAGRTEPEKPTSGGSKQQVMAPTHQQMQEFWLQMARHIKANTEDVGDRFVEEARAIHYNEAPERGIRGAATSDEAAELLDEGIDIMAFPMPASVKGPVQ